jgi:hypothetical protein
MSDLGTVEVDLSNIGEEAARVLDLKNERSSRKFFAAISNLDFAERARALVDLSSAILDGIAKSSRAKNRAK